MGQSKLNSTNIFTPGQNQTLEAILNQASSDTGFLSEQLKAILMGGGPTGSRVQQAVTNYKENIIPQLLGSLGGGQSSSALNQALSTGAQNLAQDIDARSMTDAFTALQLLQQMTSGNVSAGLGADPTVNHLVPGKTQTALNTILGLLGGGLGEAVGGAIGGPIGGALGGLGSLGGKVIGKVGKKVGKAVGKVAKKVGGGR